MNYGCHRQREYIFTLAYEKGRCGTLPLRRTLRAGAVYMIGLGASENVGHVENELASGRSFAERDDEHGGLALQGWKSDAVEVWHLCQRF